MKVRNRKEIIAMTRRLLTLATLLLLATPAAAQSVPETVLSWDLKFFSAGVNPATGAPLLSANITVAASTCDLAPITVPPGPIVNPTRIFIDDPALPGRVCQLAPTTSAGLLLSVPLGVGIVATAEARGATQVSPRSAASAPFTRAIVPVAPAVPTNLRITP